MSSQGSRCPALLHLQPDSRSARPSTFQGGPRKKTPPGLRNPAPGRGQPAPSPASQLQLSQMAAARMDTSLIVILGAPSLQNRTALPATRALVSAAPWGRNLLCPEGKRKWTYLKSTFQELRKREHPQVISPSRVPVSQTAVVLVTRNLSAATLATRNPSRPRPRLWAQPSEACLPPLQTSLPRMEP